MIHSNLSRSLILWALAAFAFAPAAPVDAPNPVYPFLRRLEVRGVLDRPFLGSLPFPRSEVLRLLRQAEADSARLGPWEKQELARYLSEFDPALHRRTSFLSFTNAEDSSQSVWGKVEYFTSAYSRDSLPKRDGRIFSTFTPHVDGDLSPNLGFVSEATVGSEKSRYGQFLMNYDPQRGLPYNTRKRLDSLGRNPEVLDAATTFDAFRTVISWRGNGYGLDVGNDWNQWGPGVWQHPTFGPDPWIWANDSLPASDLAGFKGTELPGSARSGYRYPGEAAPLTQLRLDFTWHSLKYTKFLAEKTGLQADEEAYVVAHRLEIRFGRNLLVGMHEMVAYAGRAFEPIYAVPFVPLKFAEHQVGDRDNTALGFDVDYRLPGGMRVYSELFLDDLLGPLEIFSDWWGNKYAWLIGGEAYDLLVPASCLQIEYARVEPWLFGHNKYNNELQNYGSLLGSSIPPNSHAVWMRWTKALPAGFSVDLEYAFLQRQLRARGSSIFDVHVDATDGTTKEFLGENPETRNSVRAGLSARYGRYALGKLSLGYLRVDNWKDDPSTELSGPSAAGELTLTY